MSNAAIYDQLEEAINHLLAGEPPTPDAYDEQLHELLPIAQDLRLAPRPEFRRMLLAELSTSARAVVSPRANLFRFSADGYPVQGSNFGYSAMLHAAALFLLCSGSLWVARQQTLIPREAANVVTDIAPYLPAAPSTSGGGGGGDHDRLPACQGTPPRFAQQQVTPPAIVVRNNAPKLAVEPTVFGPPPVQLSKLNNLGDPLSAVLTPSNGTGTGSGIGTGSGGGVGSGEGSGVGPGYGGGIGGGVYRIGNGVSAPRVLYDPDPQYSDEARKAKLQGVVVLNLIVGPDGRPHNPRVQRSLGMGLDEKALEAVRTWKFEPAQKDGHPVAVQISVEVNFRMF